MITVLAKFLYIFIFQTLFFNIVKKIIYSGIGIFSDKGGGNYLEESLLEITNKTVNKENSFIKIDIDAEKVYTSKEAFKEFGNLRNLGISFTVEFEDKYKNWENSFGEQNPYYGKSFFENSLTAENDENNKNRYTYLKCRSLIKRPHINTFFNIGYGFNYSDNLTIFFVTKYELDSKPQEGENFWRTDFKLCENKEIKFYVEKTIIK